MNLQQRHVPLEPELRISRYSSPRAIDWGLREIDLIENQVDG